MHKAIERLMMAGLALLDQYEALPLPLTNAANETTGSGGLAFHDGLQAGGQCGMAQAPALHETDIDGPGKRERL